MIHINKYDKITVQDECGIYEGIVLVTNDETRICVLAIEEEQVGDGNLKYFLPFHGFTSLMHWGDERIMEARNELGNPLTTYRVRGFCYSAIVTHTYSLEELTTKLANETKI